MIEHHVEFGGPFGALPLAPVIYAGAQFDQRAVDAHQGIAEPEAPLPRARDLRAAAEQRFEHFLVQLPRPVLVGVTQRGFLGCLGHAQVLQLPFTGHEPAADFT